MTATLSIWEKIQAYLWLGLSVGCLFFALVFWAITETREELVQVEKEPETEVELQIQPEKVAAMNHLGALFEEVKPLDMSKRIAVTAQHEAEFRGTKFIQDNQKKYAITLFQVRNEEIIKSFLRKQINRKPFIYLRLSGEGQTEQYVLLYGNYASEVEAQAALTQLNLGLPDSVKPELVRFDRFTKWVNDLGADELVTHKIYAVNLKVTAVPQVDELELQQRRAAAERAAEIARQQLPTSTTTVTRRDADGNVVDVQRSQSHADTQQNGSNSVQEVVDPFN